MSKGENRNKHNYSTGESALESYLFEILYRINNEIATRKSIRSSNPFDNIFMLADIHKLEFENAKINRAFTCLANLKGVIGSHNCISRSDIQKLGELKTLIGDKFDEVMFTLSKDQSKIIAKAKEDLSEKHASTISAFNDISYNPARIDSSLNRAEISRIINNIFSSGIRKLEESNVIDIPSMETKFNVDKEKYEILYKKIDEELLKDKRVPIDFIDAYRIILAREKYQYISMLINSIDLSERYDMTNQLLDKIRFSCSSRITSCDAQLKSVYLGDIFDLDKKDEIMKKKREGQAVIDEIDKIIASNNMSRSGYIKNGKSFEEEPEEEVIVTYSRDPGSVRRR